MSFVYTKMNTPTNKKAVHVKWAGKTIALGTFPLTEADEKCARAKALTRAWRSTMRPKPHREWVMTELERLNVRVVSGRPSKDINGSDDDVSDNVAAAVSGTNGNEIPGNTNTITASLLNAAEMARGLGIDANSFLSQQGPNSSLTMSLLADDGRDPNISAAAAAMGNAIHNKSELEPHHRPLVGGGSAAAYEAARADHYRKLAEQKSKPPRDKIDVNDSGAHGGQLSLPGTSTGLSSLGALINGDSSNNQMTETFAASNGTSAGGAGGNNGGSMGLSVNPNAHYEMLKLHHMNLLNEIQETTLMMNLYQQQQLQQQQRQRKIQQEQQLLAQQAQQQQAQQQQAQQQQQLQQLQQHQQLQQQQQQQKVQQQQQHRLLEQSIGRSNSLGLGSRLPTNFDTRNIPPAAQKPQSRSDIMNDTTKTFPPKTTSEPIEELQQQEYNKAAASAAAASELNEHEKQLQKIKNEIEERKRMLEQLEKGTRTKLSTGKEKSKDATDEDDYDDDDDEDDDDYGKEDVKKDSSVVEPPAKKIKMAI